MSEESALVAQFAAARSDEAFAAIVKLHLKLVFATAYRQVGDRLLAEEVTQNVFMALAQNAGSLKENHTLAGWLYRTTLNKSRELLRSELRRRRREEIAAVCAEISRDGRSTWAELMPLLDEALLGLTEPDRLAVILYYVEGRRFPEVGRALGVGEDAARKRVNRSLNWLTNWFQKRGFPVTTGAIATALSSEGIPAASAALVTSICLAASASFPATPVAAGALASTLGFLMTSTKIKIALGGVALALLVSTPLLFRNRTAAAKPEQHLTSAANQNPIQRVNQEDVQFARTPTENPLGAETAEPPPRQKSFFERVNSGDESLSFLSREQADAFVERNRTNAESLLAAYRVTHDPKYLRSAAGKFPNDPRVLFRAVAHDALPEKRRNLLEQYKQADADNSLPYYLSAADHLKNGDLESAFQDLGQATAKETFRDYITESILTLEDIYLAAGHSPVDAKALATCAVELPHLTQLNEMSRSMVELVGQYQNSGDDQSAQNLVAMGLRLSGHLAKLQEGGNLLGQIVAIRTERSFLEQLDSGQSYPFLTATVDERISAGRAREQAIREDSQFVNEWIPEATEPEIISYLDRLKIHGESAAIEWLRNRAKP